MEILDENDCLDWSPKSICVPRGKSVTVWDECGFGNDNIELTDSVEDIDEYNFSSFLGSKPKVEKKKPVMKTEKRVTVLIESL